MKAIFTLLVLIIGMMVSSCQESDLSPDQRLEFQLVVFNELGERTNSLTHIAAIKR